MVNLGLLFKIFCMAHKPHIPKTTYQNGAPRGFGDLVRMAIYFQGAGEHW